MDIPQPNDSPTPSDSADQEDERPQETGKQLPNTDASHESESSSPLKHASAKPAEHNPLELATPSATSAKRKRRQLHRTAAANLRSEFHSHPWAAE